MPKSRDSIARYLARFLVLIALFSLTGCSATSGPGAAAKAPDEPPKGDLRVAHVLAKEGMEKLGRHRYEDASRIFNAGLKFSPDNAQLHFLNGLTYHLQYLRGDEGKKEFALTGYKLALNYDPAHYHAALQLGRLEFEAKRYERSIEAFRHAIEIEPQNGDAYFGLAAAAYYARDLAGARTAVEKAVSLLPDNAEVARAAAMVYAALDDQASARGAAGRYALLEKSPRARDRLSSRVEQWRIWHAAFPAQRKKEPAAILAQIYAPPSGGNAAAASAPQSPSAPASPAAAAAVPAPPAGAARPAWFDCGASSFTASSAAGSNTGGDETTALPSLPTPCQGAVNPRMVVLDIAFIRAEDNASSSQGVNLLNGLTYVFNQSRELLDVLERRNNTPESRSITITNTRSRGLPMTGIGYSLNIANSTDSRTEVLAKPSLVALDRMPSTFFAGNNVTLGIAGTNGSASSVSDRAVGISLSATPTFIDDETVLLAVKASRSFVEPVNEAVIFNNTLQTSRNAVSANVVLKMGQTLILSGLSEHEVQRNSDGVPILKDIPVLQYLFATKMVQNFTRSVLVLITPRMPAYDGEIMEKTIKHIDTLGSEKARYRPLIEKATKAAPGSAPINLEETYRHSFGSKLFLQFRSGDLDVQHWSEPSRLEGFIRDLAELLYF